MERLSDTARVIKCVFGVLMIVSFFLPWVAQTPSCMDKTVVIRDNISGFTLVREGTVVQALAAPLFGIAAAALALIVRGRAMPLFRSLVSLVEIPVAVYLIFYVDVALRLFTPFVIRYGYITTEVLFYGIPIISLSEVGIHFEKLKRNGKVIVGVVIVAYVIMALVGYLSRHMM